MANVHSWKLVGFGTAALIAGFAFTGGGGCSSSGDNSARTGTGGTTATTGGSGTTTAGSGTTTAGTSSVVAGSANGGSSTTAGGSTAAGGTAGAATGGAGTDMCGFPTTTAPTPVIYDGVTTAPTCGTTPKMPWGPVAFAYGDNSVCTAAGKPLDADRAALVPPLPPCTAADPGAIVNAGAKGGCQGAGDCALHVTGSGFTDYGAGIGFDVNDNGSNSGPAVAFDASAYMGLQFWVKGTISGTRGPKYAATPNSLHIKFVTSTARSGDDYGGYCTVGTDWTMCSLTFAAATRDGFSSTPPVASDMLDIMNLLKLQFEFSKFSPAADAGASPPVAFDVMFDEISFF